MAQDLERLVVSLEANIKKYEAQMARAAGMTDKRMRDITKSTHRAMGDIDARMASVGKALIGGAALKGAQVLIDTATRIDNALKVAGLSGDELTKVYDALFVSAQKNAAPLEALVQLYGRASLVQKELGVSTEQLLKFTDNVAVALRVSGKSAAESSGALLQLSQALGSGVVRAEEFNSMLEGALPIVQAAANGILEAGGSVSKLRQLVVDGKVSSAAFFKGFQAGAVMLNQQVAGASLTVAQGFTRLENAAVDAAKRVNDAAGISKTATSALDALAIVVTKLGDAFAYLSRQAGDSNATKQIDDIGVAARNLWNDPSFRNLYAFLFDTSGSRATAAANDAVSNRVKGIDALRKAMADANAEAGKAASKASKTPSRFDDAFAPFATKKISLRDNPVTAKDKKDGTATELDTFQRRMAMTQRQINLMGVEAKSIDMTVEARERARVVVELETAAREANRKAGEDNIDVTEEQRKKIDALADAYGKAKGQLEQLNGPLASFARESANVGQQLEGFAVQSLDRIADDFGDIVTGTKTVGEAFKNMAASIIFDLAKIAIKQAVLGPLASLMGAGGGLGSLLGGAVRQTAGIGGLPAMYDKGGYTGSGGKYQPAGVVHKGEYVFDADAVKKIGVQNLERLRGYADGGFVGGLSVPRITSPTSSATVSAPVTVSIDARGADREGLARVEQSVARLRSELPALTVAHVRAAQKSRAL